MGLKLKKIWSLVEGQEMIGKNSVTRTTRKNLSDEGKTTPLTIRQPIRVDPAPKFWAKKIPSGHRSKCRSGCHRRRRPRTHLEFSALVGDVIAGSGRSVERAAVFRATPAVCEPRHCRTAGGGGGICVTRSAITFGEECRRSRSCRRRRRSSRRRRRANPAKRRRAGPT